MKSLKHILRVLLFACVLFPLSAASQVVEVPVEGTEKTTGSTSREVDVSEDTYRRFMELKDLQRERNFIPETVFQPRGNLQKIAELPEDSQKHLRNQLREIILQGEQWKPGDELVDHPYTPSVAALTNRPLQKLEAEAWGELVGEYHQREAEIYTNSARSNTAMASATNQGGENDHGDGSDKGNAGGANAGDQANNQQNIGSDSAAVDGYSPHASAGSDSSTTVGISQNALEFLTRGEFVVPEGTLAIKDLVNARGVSKEQEDDDG